MAIAIAWEDRSSRNRHPGLRRHDRSGQGRDGRIPMEPRDSAPPEVSIMASIILRARVEASLFTVMAGEWNSCSIDTSLRLRKALS